jgi:hypothetical protein
MSIEMDDGTRPISTRITVCKLEPRLSSVRSAMRAKLPLSALIVTALTACAAIGVPATSDPTQKLRDSEDLFGHQGRPLPAENLIVQAIAKFDATGDSNGLAEGYRTYGLFFRSTHLRTYFCTIYRIK